MTEQEFKASLTKEQQKYYDAAIGEALSLEEKYYRENVSLKQEIMLMLHALNFQPIQSVPHLSEMMRGTRQRFVDAQRQNKPITPSQREEFQNQIEALRGRMNTLTEELRRVEDALRDEESRWQPGRAESGRGRTKLADCGPTIEKLGDPIPISDTELQSLASRFPEFADPGEYVGEPRRL